MMNPKYCYVVEEVQGLSDAINDIAYELRSGELSGEPGRQFMRHAAFEMLTLKQRCTDVISAFMSNYAKDYADLSIEYSQLGHGTTDRSN